MSEKTSIFKRGGNGHFLRINGKKVYYQVMKMPTVTLDKWLGLGWSLTLEDALSVQPAPSQLQEKAKFSFPPVIASDGPVKDDSSESDRSSSRGRPTRDVLEKEALEHGIPINGLTYRELEKLVIEARKG